jgi:hypothetical protein
LRTIFWRSTPSFFLIACFSSYWALRTRSAQRMHRVERFADVVFLLALVLMAVNLCLRHLRDHDPELSFE